MLIAAIGIQEVFKFKESWNEDLVQFKSQRPNYSISIFKKPLPCLPPVPTTKMWFKGE